MEPFGQSRKNLIGVVVVKSLLSASRKSPLIQMDLYENLDEKDIPLDNRDPIFFSF